MTIQYVPGPGISKSSQDSTQQQNRRRLRHAIRDFLTAKSSTPPPEQVVCPRCGRAMQQVNATFSLYGSDREWSLHLPVCPCSRESASKDVSDAELKRDPQYLA